MTRGAAGVWLGPVLLVVYVQRFQSLPEERALRAAFGTSFDADVEGVRR